MLRIFYTCLKCGYQHPVIENGDIFSPAKTLTVRHTDEKLKQPCTEQLLHRVDESFSFDDVI